jgi:hypothetical protein
VTFATIEAQAIEKQRASPWIIAVCGMGRVRIAFPSMMT